MILNLGPQHPATHGTLRLVVRLDGERVLAADPVIGYMHRGYEKLTEFRTYPQITTLINRIDWLSSFANEVPFIDAAERIMGIEAPPRAVYIRTILTELSRIATFILFLGEMGLQVGALTPGVLRVPRPRARPQPDRGGDRRAVPPELQPHRRPQGRPPVGLDRRHAHRDGKDPRRLRHLRRPRARQRDLRRPDPVDRHHPGRAGGVVRRVGLEPPGIGRRLGPAA